MKKLTFLIAILVFGACGSSREYVQNPVDTLIKEMDKEPDFTVILFDMKEEGSFSTTYKHMYKVIKPAKTDDAKPVSTTTDWKEVSKDFFFQHEGDMGMEIASKKDGKVTKQTAPPGYSNYVGNQKYGQWQSRSDGTSFWAFYGQYAFMSNMLGLMGGPVYRRSYTDYNTNYRGTRPYYGGTTSKPLYGTYSSTALKQNPKSNFASKVQSRTSRSSGTSASRSGSRYSSGSSSRSRSSSSRGGK